MKIQQAKPKDAAAITALTLRSKDYWNYGSELIESWRKELTVTPEFIENNEVYNLIDEDKIIGFYIYSAENQLTVKLNFLFVEPNFIGQGYGKILVNDFLNRIKTTSYKSVIVDADPNAEPFYNRLGFQVVDQLPSSIEGRFLPIMELKL
ncbi:MAG: GNAT family N-acetyltransferase [Saprospiraceae bacterium]